MEKTFAEELKERTVVGICLSNEEKQNLLKQHNADVEKILHGISNVDCIDEAIMTEYFDTQLRFLADCGQGSTMFFDNVPNSQKAVAPRFSYYLPNVLSYVNKRDLIAMYYPKNKHTSFGCVIVKWSDKKAKR